MAILLLPPGAVRSRWSPARTDAVLACLVAVVVGLSLVGLSLSAAGFAVALVLPLAWRRTRPAVAVGLVVGVGLALLLAQGLGILQSNGFAARAASSPLYRVEVAVVVAYGVAIVLVHNAAAHGSVRLSVVTGLLSLVAVPVEAFTLRAEAVGLGSVGATLVAVGFLALPILVSWGTGALRTAVMRQPLPSASVPPTVRLPTTGAGRTGNQLFSERLDLWLSGHVLLVDAVLAATLALLLGLLELSAGNDGWHALNTVALVLPLAWRRTRPVRAMVLVAAFGLVQWVVDLVTVVSAFASRAPLANGQAQPYVDIPSPRLGDVAVFVVVYSVAAYGSRQAGVVTVVLGCVGAVMETFLLLADDVWLNSYLPVLVATALVIVAVVGTWALGALRRTRLTNVEALRERARLLEVERDQQSRLATAAERSRIAREMHDVVAHSLAVVIAQADGGRYAARTSPQAAEQALETIGETGRRALAEMRELLGVLRAGPQERSAPQPDVDGVGALVEQTAASGTAVTLEVDGQPQPLPRAAGLAVYRIVQESLTNVLKHAGPGVRAQVRLVWGPSTVEVTVQDDGRGAGAAPPEPGGGNGLVGMRERAALSGGRLEAGPRAGGGFVVHAVLPLLGSPPLTPGAVGTAGIVQNPSPTPDPSSTTGPSWTHGTSPTHGTQVGANP